MTSDDWETTDDWDFDDPADDECGKCQAILDEFRRCWYCNRSWIWIEAD